MSTIKVDTIQTRGGASEIAIDKLKGASSAGSMTVVGEGGSTTTNLQQGLAKAFCNYASNNSNEILDSFNVSTMTDVTDGSVKSNLTNNMDNSNYAISASTESMNEAIDYANHVTTSTMHVSTFNSSHSASDNAHTAVIAHGGMA